MRNESYDDLKAKVKSGLKVQKKTSKDTGFYMPPELRYSLGDSRGCSFVDIAKFYVSTLETHFSTSEIDLIESSYMEELSNEIEAIFNRKGGIAKERLEEISPGIWYDDTTNAGFALASSLEIPKVNRTPVPSANLAHLVNVSEWTDNEKFVKTWDLHLTKPVEVVFSDCWDKENSLVVSVTDGLQSKSIRTLGAMSRIRSGKITVEEFINNMFIHFVLKIDARGSSPDVVDHLLSKAFSAQEFATQIENGVKHRGHLANSQGSTMRELADMVSEYLGWIAPGTTIVDMKDTDNLHGNTLASDSDIYLKVIDLFGRDELIFGGMILNKLYHENSSITFSGPIGINDFNIANMMVRFIQTQYQIKMASLSVRQRNILASNCAKVLAKVFDKITNDSKDAVGKVRRALLQQADDEKDIVLGSIRSNHDQICAQFAVALLHKEIGDELNELGNTTLSEKKILSMKPNKTGWDENEVNFKITSKYWGFVAKDFVKTLELESILDEKVQDMVLVKNPQNNTVYEYIKGSDAFHQAIAWGGEVVTQ